MHPILFVLESDAGVRPIASFGVLLALAMLLGSFVGIRGASRAGIHWSDGLSAASILCGAGLVGGYAAQIVVESVRSGSIDKAIATGGLTFYGAPIVGTLALVLAAKPLGISFLRFVDSAILSVPIAHALGRMGCFFAGCCYGSPYDGPFAVAFHHPMAAAAIDPVPRHPVQLYESFALLVTALVFALVPARSVGDGRRATSYLAVYAAIRIVMERFRGDAERGFLTAGVSTSDAISVVLLGASAAFLVITRRAKVAS